MYDRKGFSLIEIIIVVALLGTAIGFIIPVYNNMKPSLRLNGAARQLMGDLMWARMQAISQNNEFRIFFSNDHQKNSFSAYPQYLINNHQYLILDDNNNDNDYDEDTEDLQQNYPDVTINPVPSQNPIFDPKGLLHYPIGITINLTNSHGTKTITIASTGRVKID